jgi:hypothetical protein
MKYCEHLTPVEKVKYLVTVHQECKTGKNQKWEILVGDFTVYNTGIIGGFKISLIKSRTVR